MESANRNKRDLSDGSDDDAMDVSGGWVKKTAPSKKEVSMPTGACTTNYSHTQIDRPSMDHIRAVTDTLRVKDLKFIVLSCAAQGMRQVTDNNKCAVKIRGAFDTGEEAELHAQALQQEDPYFDIYVAPMYEWIAIPPETSMCEEVHMPNKTVEEIMNRELQYRHASATKLEQRIQGAKDDLNTQDAPMTD